MKLSYHWLKELLGEIKVSPEKMAEILSAHLAETKATNLSSPYLENVYVGEIVDLKLHPQDQRLQVAEIDLGKKYKKLQIVCGAVNIKVRQKIPVALVGAKLVNGLEIKKAVIRGIESEGMLCAEDELGLGSDHTGILILPQEAKIGDPLARVLELDETIFEIENVSLTQRPDLFSHQGMAFEMSACLRQPLVKKEKQIKTDRKLNQDLLKVKLEAEDLCPRYMAVVLQGVKIGPSPLWMQNRLKNLGLRPINNVVDITNYILFELGQPLHAFDAEKLKGKEIIIRRAKNGEKILALDSREYELNVNDLVIADSSKPVALAGIMGGEETGVSEKTKTIVIESANFEPINIRKTSKRLNLITESSLRFEKGLPVPFAERGIKRAIELLEKFAQAKVVSKVYDLKTLLAQARLTKRRKILIDPQRIKKIIGQEIEEKEMLQILRVLGFEIKQIDLIKELVKLAQAQIGKPYKYGASTFIEAPDIFDCSSLTRWLYRQIGVELPRISAEQASSGEKIEVKNLQAGDLVFRKRKSDNLIFKKNSKSDFPKEFSQGIGHVGLLIAKDKVIHAESKKKKVVVENSKSFLNKNFVLAKRILKEKKGLVVTVPDFRPDILTEEDLIEEIVRLYGISKIKPQPLKGELLPAKLIKEFLLKQELKDLLKSFGFFEVYNYSFSGEDELKEKKKGFELINPINLKQKYLRQTLLPGLIKNYEKNNSLFDEFKIFEIGKVFNFEGEIIEEDHLALLIYQKEKNTFWQMKGVLETILEKIGLNLEKISFEEIGSLGLIENEVGVFELNLEKIYNLPKEAIVFKPISLYPAVKRDLAFLLDKNIKWGDIYKKIKEINPLIVKIELFDVFESEKFGKRRNLAFHIIYQSYERTLTSEEVEGIEKKIVEILEKEFGGQLRTF